MSRAAQAREAIKVAIVEGDGVYAVAQRAGVHFTRVYAFLRGAGLTEENAGKLRAALPGVPPEVWAEAFAPTPDVAAP